MSTHDQRIQEMQKGLVATDTEAYIAAMAAITHHSSQHHHHMAEFQAFNDEIAEQTIPWEQATKGSSKMILFARNITRVIEGEEVKGYLYAETFMVDDTPVFDYTCMFKTNEEGEIVDFLNITSQESLDARIAMLGEKN